MWPKLIKDDDFLELRPGALKELKIKFKKFRMLHKRYERELGADKVKQIRTELGLQSEASRNQPGSSSYSTNGDAATSSEPVVPSTSDSSKNVEPVAGVGVGSNALGSASSETTINRKTPNKMIGSQSEVINKKKKTLTDTDNGEATTSSELVQSTSDSSKNAEEPVAGTSGVGVGSYGMLGSASSETNINRKTPNKMIGSQPQSEVIKKKKKKIYTDTDTYVSDAMVEDLARTYGGCDEDSDAVELLKLSSEWATRMLKHRRDADGRPCFNCVCGYKCSSKEYLESHLKWKIFGKAFKCPHQNCEESFYQFNHFKQHFKQHGTIILNEEGCFMCGAQFRKWWELELHDRICLGRSKLDAALL